MSSIRLIEVKGLLEISGIFNYNGVVSVDGNENHKKAKQDKNRIDFTSSRCLRHEMFKDLQPRQPISTEFRSHYINLAASEIGLLRGIMDADYQLTRPSPISVIDAYTCDKEFKKTEYSQIFFDQGSSSKPKEVVTEKNKKGKEKSDISMFSSDNAPNRNQLFHAFINIKQLQFIEQDEELFKIVPFKNELDESNFLKKLTHTFKKYNINSEFNFAQYAHIGAISSSTSRGLLLTDEQISALIKSSLLRMLNISSYKTGSYIKSIKETFSVLVTFDDAHDSQEFKLKDFLEKLERREFDFVKFYKPL